MLIRTWRRRPGTSAESTFGYGPSLARLRGQVDHATADVVEENAWSHSEQIRFVDDVPRDLLGFARDPVLMPRGTGPTDNPSTAFHELKLAADRATANG